MSAFLKSTHNLCVFLGAYTLCRVSYDLFSGYIKYYQNPPKSLKSLYGSGRILITGGTDGLGLAFANEFASQGHDLIILARNQDKLRDRKEQIERDHNVKVETISFDLCTSDLTKYESLREKLKEFEISIFLNNAAMFNVTHFGSHSFKEIKDLIVFNCLNGLFINKILTEDLRKRNQKSAIINIGSQYVDRRTAPFATLYFATKAFNNTAARSISSQFFTPKVDVITIFPGLMRTEMYRRFSKGDESFVDGLLIEDPKYFAKQSGRCLGYGEKEIFGSQRHAFSFYVCKYILGRFYDV